MIGQGRNIVRMEVGQQRDCHTAIDIDTPESHRPPSGIACTDGNLVALVDSGSGEEDAEAFYIDGQLGIGKGIAIVVTQGPVCPLFADGFLQILQIVFHKT